MNDARKIDELATALSAKLHQHGCEKTADELVQMATDAMDRSGLGYTSFSIARLLGAWASQSESLAKQWRIDKEIAL